MFEYIIKWSRMDIERERVDMITLEEKRKVGLWEGKSYIPNS